MNPKQLIFRVVKPTQLESLKMHWGRMKGRRFPQHKTVFIVGQNKTGTTSVARAFRNLGTNHVTINSHCLTLYHAGRFDALVAISRRFDSLDDWPWNQEPLIEALRDAYGDRAVFVLNTRDPEAWYSSYVRFRKHSRKPLNMEPGESQEAFIQRRLIDRNQRIREMFQAHPERLFEGDITSPDFIERLQDATGYAVRELPHINKTP